jgi:hypothetical protein
MSPVVIITIIVVGIILAICLMLLVSAMVSKGPGTGWQKEIEDRLGHISRSINPQNPQSIKLAIFEYDKLADLVLTRLRIPGKTLGEKMKAAKKLFPNQNLYNTFWNVHKLRNTLAHELNYNPHPDSLMQACIAFRQVIEYLIHR